VSFVEKHLTKKTTSRYIRPDCCKHTQQFLVRIKVVRPSENNEVNGSRAARKKPQWYYGTAKYAEPSLSKAIFQILNTFIPYFLLLSLIIYLVKAGWSIWLTLPLSIVASLFLVRIFIIFHDCCHHSFFANRRANTIFGTFCGILTCTPYADWQWAHSRHHASAADLDKRDGYGSVWTMTVKEYRASPFWTRLRYRLYRNPLVLFIPGPLIMFLLVNRFPKKGVGKPQRRSVLITNIAVLVMFSVAVWTLGFPATVRIGLPIIFVATTIGVWLFYIQHQFEGVRWFSHDQWTVMKSSLYGCSYYKLPNVLHWFTGNIGLHHIHHTRTAIPNYNLQQCFNETPEFQDINVLTIRRSLKSLWLNLWDEDRQKLVSFRSIGRRR
jgi:omega-6 fatty acid desaturase (delta-12 desaturase)